MERWRPVLCGDSSSYSSWHRCLKGGSAVLVWRPSHLLLASCGAGNGVVAVRQPQVVLSPAAAGTYPGESYNLDLIAFLHLSQGVLPANYRDYVVIFFLLSPLMSYVLAPLYV